MVVLRCQVVRFNEYLQKCQGRIPSVHEEFSHGHRLRVWFLPQLTRIVADQGVVLVFLLFVVAVQFREGDVRRLLSLLVFYFIISRRLLPLINQTSFLAREMEGTYKT